VVSRIKRILSGKADFWSLRTINKLLGRRVLFVEKPVEKESFSRKKIEAGGLRRIYVISPENHKEVGESRKEMEAVIRSMCKMAKERGVEVIPHLHLESRFCRDLEKPDKKTEKKVEVTVEFFKHCLGRKPAKFSFGHWRFTHKNPHLREMIERRGMVLAAREPHIYDWWY